MSDPSRASGGRLSALFLAFLLGVFGWLVPGSFVEMWEASVCPTAAAGSVWEATCASNQLVVWLIVGTGAAAVLGGSCGRLAAAREREVALLLAAIIGLMTVVLAFEVVILILLPSFVVGFAIGYRWLSVHRDLRAGPR